MTHVCWWIFYSKAAAWNCWRVTTDDIGIRTNSIVRYASMALYFVGTIGCLMIVLTRLLWTDGTPDSMHRGTRAQKSAKILNDTATWQSMGQPNEKASRDMADF